jgi:hypothetical protein
VTGESVDRAIRRSGEQGTGPMVQQAAKRLPNESRLQLFVHPITRYDCLISNDLDRKII